MSDTEKNILILLQAIEQKLGWGHSAQWANYDFEKLSTEIEQKTKVVLSPTTLKRLWGKVKSPHSPATNTLNVLAQFIDFEDYRNFLVAHQNNDALKGADIAILNKESFIIRHQRQLKILGLIVLGWMLLSSILFFSKSVLNKTPNPDDFQFSLNKIKTVGVPNSVIFSYNASKATTDSIYIVQTWDVRRKTLVPKNGNHHTAIYYYPGFFNTKLIIDSTVVKNQELQIATDGWLGLVESTGQPIYFDKAEISTTEGMKLDEILFQKHSITTQPVSPKVRFFNQTDLGSLMNDNFTFETEIRNQNPAADNVCHFTEVLIQCKNDIIIIPLADSACVGELAVAFAGTYKQATFNDLTGFGCNLTQWTQLKIICRDRHATFYVNGKKVFELDASHNPTGIVGVQYRFQGAAEIKYAKFWDKDGEEVIF